MRDRDINQENRMAVLDDHKKRIIDLMENGQVVPEAGIYDEPVRYFKANEEWCKIIFGWLAWLEDVAGWQDAEDTNHAGIQGIITFEEGIENMANQEDIAKGMYQFAQWLALQVATGTYKNISISTDEDGVVTPTPEGGLDADVPEDEPSTPELDEYAASVMGGASAVARGLGLFFGKLDAYYGATNGTPVSTAATAKFGINSYFHTDAAQMDTAIDIYYTYRTTNPRLLFNSSVAFEQYLYCNGADERGFNRWLIDVSGYADTKINTMHDLVTGLAEEFFSYYFSRGLKSPNTEYHTASCTKIDTEQYMLNFALADSFSFLTGTWKDSHRYLIEATGSFTDTDNPNIVKDFFWTHDLTTGNKTFDGFSLTHSGTVTPIAAQVPFQANHSYAVSLEKSGNNAGTITKLNGIFNLPNTSGIIILTITDLGLTV